MLPGAIAYGIQFDLNLYSSRGTLHYLWHGRWVALASMGPRHFSRGTDPRMSDGAGAGLLQWGRGISAAESTRGWGWSMVMIMLQWGRGISAAESATPLPGDDDLQGFNGAAVFQPRNLWCPCCGQRLSQASMGPRHFSRGIDERVGVVDGYDNASMGPRYFSRGISHPVTRG